MIKTKAGWRFIASRLWMSAMVLAVVICGCGKSKSATSEANDWFLKAKASLASGDTASALAALDQSIAIEPALWSYHERAKLRAQLGDDKAALADCEAALTLDAQDPDAAWIKSEIAKPAAARFRGKFKSSPSSNR
jgi:tetratricopeptide (TPR) repeat protein